MTKATEKTTFVHNDFKSPPTEHVIISKKDDSGNTKTYQGSGGSSTHYTEHRDGTSHTKQAEKK